MVDHGGGYAPFNSPVEIGLRATCLLTVAFPDAYSIERLVALDYLVVHSDDAGSEHGLHPQTPFRGVEVFARRGVLQEGLLLYSSRGLVERRFSGSGLAYAATDRSASFLDALDARYVRDLRASARWVVRAFTDLSDTALARYTAERAGQWGAEFTMQSVLGSAEDVG